MKICIATLLCIATLAPAADAQAIYKCVVNGATTFQQEPCPAPAAVVPGHAIALPANSPLLGTWRSDHDLTMAYLRQHTTNNPKQNAFLDQLIGRMTMTFTRDHVKTDMPDFSLQGIDGKPRPMTGFHHNDSYSVLSTSPQLVSISSANPVTSGPEVSDFHFDGRDTMWQLMGRPGESTLDPHSREYYRRVK